jgi:2-phosphoglycerate kinase
MSKKENIFWIGGSPCAGKSTITDKIALKYGIKAFHCDDYINVHLDKINQKIHPAMYRQKNMTWNDMFMKPIPEQVREEINYYTEEFNMVLDDLSEAYDGRAVIVEGTGLLPFLLKKYVQDTRKAFFLVPDKDFQVKHYKKRDFIKYILKDCKDKQLAFSNWMERDFCYGNFVYRNASKFDFKVLRVDNSTEFDKVQNYLEEYFGLKG